MASVSHSFLAGAEAECLAAVMFFEEQRASLGAALITEFERVINLAVEGAPDQSDRHVDCATRVELAHAISVGKLYNVWET